MSDAVTDFFDWTHVYWEFHSQTTETVEELEAFRHNYATLISVLPLVLEPLAVEATQAGIDPSPIINLCGGLPLFQRDRKQLELMLDAVWTVAKRIEVLEVAKTPEAGPDSKRDSERDKQKKFVPYEHCLRHNDEDIQAAAAELNRIGEVRGKTAALMAFFDERRPHKTSVAEARSMVERMKKIEQRGRDQAGQ